MAGMVPVVPAPWAPKRPFFQQTVAWLYAGWPPTTSGLVVSDQVGKYTERLIIFGDALRLIWSPISKAVANSDCLWFYTCLNTHCSLLRARYSLLTHYSLLTTVLRTTLELTTLLTTPALLTSLLFTTHSSRLYYPPARRVEEKETAVGKL